MSDFNFSLCFVSCKLRVSLLRPFCLTTDCLIDASTCCTRRDVTSVSVRDARMRVGVNELNMSMSNECVSDSEWS